MFIRVLRSLVHFEILAASAVLSGKVNDPMPTAPIANRLQIESKKRTGHEKMASYALGSIATPVGGK
jgi:hypothetical protein